MANDTQQLMKPPPRIYKYEQFSVQSLENLKSQVIYFGSPRNFNDQYDCALVPPIEPPTDAEIELIRAHFLAYPELAPHLQDEFRSLRSDVLREVLIRSTAQIVGDSANKFLDKNGVTCFSETPDNLLMWSHYASKSQGFCLEFDSANEPFAKLLQVSYSETIPSIKITSDLLLRGENLGLIEKLYCTKSKDWAYEREWRGIHHHKGIRYVYSSQSLTGIYFGPASTGPIQEIVCLVLQGQNENVRFYQGKRSATEFKVVFEEFTYTPHLTAKKAGLVP